MRQSSCELAFAFSLGDEAASQFKPHAGGTRPIVSSAWTLDLGPDIIVSKPASSASSTGAWYGDGPVWAKREKHQAQGLINGMTPHLTVGRL